MSRLVRALFCHFSKNYFKTFYRDRFLILLHKCLKQADQFKFTVKSVVLIHLWRKLSDKSIEQVGRYYALGNNY